MDRIAFLLKTYRGDYSYYRNLLKTYQKYNCDGIKLYVVVPEKDYSMFCTKVKNVIVIKEEDLLVDYFERDYHGTSAGYLNQQIVKLAFWEMELCENYFCIDADCYFIKKFHIDDFIYKDNIPYTVFYDDRELMINTDYYKKHGIKRERYNRIVRNELGCKEKVMHSCHGFAILSRKVLEDFKKNYMEKKQCTYKDIIKKAPMEFTWYHYWLQHSKCMEIYAISPLVKCYHTQKSLLLDIQQGIRTQDLAHFYIGIVLNSNFGKKENFLEYEEIRNNKKVLFKLLCSNLQSIIKMFWMKK